MLTADGAIKIMEPFIVEGTYWICSIPNNSDIPKNSIATFKESLGLSVIIKQQEKPKYICTEPKAMINVGLDTPVGYEGFLSKLINSLADKFISVYAYSAYYRDYLFVPKDKSKESLKALTSLKLVY